MEPARILIPDVDRMSGSSRPLRFFRVALRRGGRDCKDSDVITEPTVLVLGAGASHPYGFDTGTALLERARGYHVEALANSIQPLPAMDARPLWVALANTLDSSIDAMLEHLPQLEASGKNLIARMLLQQERAALGGRHGATRHWYRTLFAALDAPTLDTFRKNRITFVTYNYERSLEYQLVMALQVKFGAPLDECAAVVRDWGVIHLHGQLGCLPELREKGMAVVPYGGTAEGITDADVHSAARAIRIVHQPVPTDQPFVLARDAISASRRVLLLGFGYGRQNVERLDLKSCMKLDARVFMCVYGLTASQQGALIQRHFSPWERYLVMGIESHDVTEYLRHHAEAIT